MNSEDVTSTVEKFIVEEIMMAGKGTQIDPESSLIKSGIIDSLSLLRLIDFLEAEFGIMIEDEEVIPENFDNLIIIESLVSNKL